MPVSIHSNSTQWKTNLKSEVTQCVTTGMQEVKGQGHTRPKFDMEARQGEPNPLDEWVLMLLQLSLLEFVCRLHAVQGDPQFRLLPGAVWSCCGADPPWPGIRVSPETGRNQGIQSSAVTVARSAHRGVARTVWGNVLYGSRLYSQYPRHSVSRLMLTR